MISDARGGHVSPGVYTEERDVTYSVNSLGITSLGVAGETLKGPAFQPIKVKDFTEFTDYFGGTSTEKFKGNGLPKYELPYIAKSYLQQSKDLTVCRILGLSGFENGSALTITAKIDGETGESGTTYPVAVLRSKADYNGATDTECLKTKYEKYNPYIKEFAISEYSGTSFDSQCMVIKPSEIDAYSLEGYIIDGGVYQMDEHIFDPTESASITAYKLCNGVMVEEEIKVSGETYYTVGRPAGMKFAIKAKYSTTATKDGECTDCTSEILNVSLNSGDKDYIYSVLSIDPLVGSYHMYIESVFDYSLNQMLADTKNAGHKFTLGSLICDDEECRNFKEPFRCAETPWIVSEAIAGSESIDLKRLFKFYTISDGNASNYQVKISIQNIRIDDGLFDVVVRDFYDDDYTPVVLEKFSNCSLKKGESSYVALRIGTYDGEYESKSKYIAIRMNEEVEFGDSVPAGFLGYPLLSYGCDSKPLMAYNTVLDNNIKTKRQYFGLNKNILDEDVVNYKGVKAYGNGSGDFDPELLTNGFHLDSIMNDKVKNAKGDDGEETPLSKAPILVEGVKGFKFTTVEPTSETSNGKIPRIVTDAYCQDTIYEEKAARKFTMYMYGGFDGWDIYRLDRTNTDDYRANKYTGADVKDNPFDGSVGSYADLNATLDLHLPATAITSDYYAYLGAYNQFMNPEDIDINLFATPGIDWYNNTLLVEDALDMIEDSEDGRGGDALYIITTPQTSDSDGSIWNTEDLVEQLEDREINSSYACTYYPWVKIYDSEDKVYINLPVTKDVVKNMAMTDNNKYPWFSPAGIERGGVDCIKAVFKTTLSDEDELYGGFINPVKTFAQDGVKVWGNKTMYNKETPLNRINVRRLMLRVKKLVTSAAKNLIFEQYDATLEKQFISLVDPILSNVQQNRGITAYKIVTECTAETRDQHILPAKILIKPTPALEYISISFVVYPESVEFDESL